MVSKQAAGMQKNMRNYILFTPTVVQCQGLRQSHSYGTKKP